MLQEKLKYKKVIIPNAKKEYSNHTFTAKLRYNNGFKTAII